MIRLLIAILLAEGIFLGIASNQRSGHVWKGLAENDHFPEFHFVANTPNTGLCLSGGGSRAYSAGTGILRALHDLDLLKNVRYIVGVSGGAWLTAAFAYAQTPVADDTLLGPYWEPENITLEVLNYADSSSIRSFVSKKFKFVIAEELALDIFHLQPLHRVYERALSRIFLEPVGITLDTLYTWSAETKRDIVERNPSLGSRKWITVTHNQSRYRPYPIVETTLLGPFNLIPFKLNRRTYIQSEMTPLYVGSPASRNISYQGPMRTEKHLIGGLVEPQIYGSMPPAHGLKAEELSGFVNASVPKDEYSLARFIAESSWNFASVSESRRDIAEIFGGAIPYWSTGMEHPKEFKMDIADGGDLENSGLMSLLRRGVEHIVVAYNTYTPLAPRSAWNPHERLPNNTEIDSMIAAYFGIFLDPPQETSWNYRSCQVFSSDDFATFASQLQDAQASGKGAVLTTKLQTITNQWNIPSGFTIQITWLYLSRNYEWEKRLPPGVADLIVPKNSSTGLPIEDPRVLPTHGPFTSFPYYPTSWLELHPNQANLLASLAASSVRLNEELVRQTLDYDDIHNKGVQRANDRRVYV